VFCYDNCSVNKQRERKGGGGCGVVLADGNFPSWSRLGTVACYYIRYHSSIAGGVM